MVRPEERAGRGSVDHEQSRDTWRGDPPPSSASRTGRHAAAPAEDLDEHLVREDDQHRPGAGQQHQDYQGHAEQARGGEGRPVSRRRKPATATKRSAGRNVPQSIAVGLGLVGVLLLSLYLVRSAFVGLASVAVLVAVWELTTAFGSRGVRLAILPLGVGSVAMLVAAYAGGIGPLLGCFLATCAALLAWRAYDGPDGFVRDASAGVFTAAYVPLLTGFALLMLQYDDGPDRVVAFVLAVVANDVGGFVAGVLWGRHPMSPRISPRKSWEGFAGSVIVGAGVSAATVPLLLDGPVWGGIVLGVAAVVTATAGDLTESLIKRDLDIKDMGSLLPGHGGLMDRLDSLLPTAPVAYLVFAHVLTH